MADPSKKFPYPQASSVTPQERQSAIEFVDRFLRQVVPSDGPRQSLLRVFGLNAPDGTLNTPDEYVEDPQAQMAAQDLLNQYPELAKGISTIHVGSTGLGGGVHGLKFPTPLQGGSGISLAARPDADNMSVWDTMRHEMGHVAGLPDIGNGANWSRRTDAYDLTAASQTLHKDVQLPTLEQYLLNRKKQ